MLQADARVKLSLWFTLSDFPGGGWGLYYFGNYLSSDQKLAYAAFKNQNSCPVCTTGFESNTLSQNLSLVRDNENYFLFCELENEVDLSFTICSVARQEIKKERFVLHEGKNKTAIDLRDLSPGLYLLNTKFCGINKIFKLLVY